MAPTTSLILLAAVLASAALAAPVKPTVSTATTTAQGSIVVGKPLSTSSSAPSPCWESPYGCWDFEGDAPIKRAIPTGAKYTEATTVDVEPTPTSTIVLDSCRSDPMGCGVHPILPGPLFTEAATVDVKPSPTSTTENWFHDPIPFIDPCLNDPVWCGIKRAIPTGATVTDATTVDAEPSPINPAVTGICAPMNDCGPLGGPELTLAPLETTFSTSTTKRRARTVAAKPTVTAGPPITFSRHIPVPTGHLPFFLPSGILNTPVLASKQEPESTPAAGDHAKAKRAMCPLPILTFIHGIRDQPDFQCEGLAKFSSECVSDCRDALSQGDWSFTDPIYKDGEESGFEEPSKRSDDEQAYPPTCPRGILELFRMHGKCPEKGAGFADVCVETCVEIMEIEQDERMEQAVKEAAEALPYGTGP